MRRWRQAYRGAIALALGGICVSGGGLSAADLQDVWAVFSEASTDGYYRDRVHSASSSLGAIARLPELAKSSRPRERVAAEALIQGIGQKKTAAIAAARSRVQLKSDEKLAQMKMLAGGLYQSRGIAEQMLGPKGMSPPEDDGSAAILDLYMGTMLGPNGLGASATRMAQADMDAANARLKLHATWEAKVFPAIRRATTAELSGRVLEFDITGSGSAREVWSSVRNVAGKTLTNVTVILKVKDGKKDLAPQSYFVRDWPAGVVIRPDPFRMWSIATGMPGTQPPSGLSASFEVWCDQGHAKPAAARSVGFYELRDPFVETMVREGARYVHLGEDAQIVLEFTRASSDRNAKSVEAKLTRIKAGGSSKPEVLRYRGLWVADRNPKGRHDEVVDLKLKLSELGSKPLPTPPNRRSRPGARPVQEYPSMTFRWDRPNYLIEMNPGESFRVQPLPDAKAAK